MSRDPVDTNKLAGMAFGEALERLANTDPRQVAVQVNASLKDGAIERLIAAFEDAAHIDDEGVEFWLARDLARLLEYADYRNFLYIVEKAKIACKTSGQEIANHFGNVTEMVDIGSGAASKRRSPTAPKS